MLRTRGNLASSRRPGLDVRVSYELSKIIRSVPNITTGDQFPGRGSTFGDMHYYNGEDTTSYKKNNWYIRTTDADSVWQSMNATSLVPENIQAGTIGSGVKIVDYLALLGGEMLGSVIFHESQKFDPSMISSGSIPKDVKVLGYVPQTGGAYTGNLDLTDHSLTSVGKLYGLDNLIYCDMSIDGNLTLGADVAISLISPVINLTGAVAATSITVGGAAVLTAVTADAPLSGAGTAASHLVVDLSNYVTKNSAPVLQATNFTDYNIVCTDDDVVVSQGEVVYA